MGGDTTHWIQSQRPSGSNQYKLNLSLLHRRRLAPEVSHLLHCNRMHSAHTGYNRRRQMVSRLHKRHFPDLPFLSRPQTRPPPPILLPLDLQATSSTPTIRQITSTGRRWLRDRVCHLRIPTPPTTFTLMSSTRRLLVPPT